MRILIIVIVAVASAFLGYKLAQYRDNQKKIADNIQPIVDELKNQLLALNTKLSSATLTEEEKTQLQTQQNNILSLLGNFYGYTLTELKKLLNIA